MTGGAVQGDDGARRLLAGLTRRHGQAPGLGCDTVAHRDLGFCSPCVAQANRDRNADYAAGVEITAWRLLAIAERGYADQPGGGS